MRIGIAGSRTPQWPKLDWVQTALVDLGHEVFRASEARELKDLTQNCDLVILGQKSLCGRWPNVKDALENRLCPVIYWWFDLICMDQAPLPEQFFFKTFRPFFEVADLVLVKERGRIEEYRSHGVRAEYLDQGFPEHLPYTPSQSLKWDVLLWGQCGGHYKRRTQDARICLEQGSLGWACEHGAPLGERLPWTHPQQLGELVSRSGCVLSCGRRNDLEGYWSDGFWLALGLGACVLRRETPGLPDGPYLRYDSDESLIDALRWAKRCPEERQELGRMARTWVLENHTIRHRVQEALALAAGAVACNA